MLGQKKDPTRPRRYGTPPTQTLEPARPATPPPKVEPRDEFFPIPDDLREMFGMPPVEKEEKKVMPKGVPKLEGWAVEVDQVSLAAEEGQPRHQEAIQDVHRENSAVLAPRLNLTINKNAVREGIIWAEILNNPRIKRIKRYNYKA